MGVRVCKFERDRPRYVRPAAASLSDGIFETVRQIETSSVLRPRHRIEDRLPTPCDHAVDDQASFACLNIHVEVDLGENGVMHLLERRGKHLEECGSGLGILAADDACGV